MRLSSRDIWLNKRSSRSAASRAERYANAKKWFKSDRPLSGVLPKSGWLTAGKALSLAYDQRRILEVEIGFVRARIFLHRFPERKN